MEISYKKLQDIDGVELVPKIIYKYRNFKDLYHRKVITEQEIYLSRPSEFFCPYDMNYVVDKEYVKDELNRREYYRKHFKCNSLYDSIIDKSLEENPITDDLLMNYENYMKEQFDEIFGVFSTSESYRNQRLWEDFGDNKKGFCVGIDFLKAIPMEEGFKSRVDYVKREDLPKQKVLDIEGDNVFFESFLEWIFKLPEEYVEEQEYRFVKQVNSEFERKRIIPKDSIFEIIIGENMSKANINELIELVELNLPQTKIKRLKYSKGGLQEIIIK